MGGHFSINLMPFAAAEASGEPNLLGFYVYVGLVLAIIAIALGSAKKGLNHRVFTSWITSCFEQLYLFIENMTVGIIGSHGRKYIPFIISLWLVIFTGNLLSLFMPYSP